jgi:hypothetical protein
MKIVEPEFIDTKGLAAMLSVSVKTIEKHRLHIAGAQKVFGSWRFHLQTIRSRIATGKDIVVKDGKR